ncbi:MAG: 3-methyl-2-oxobutanoate dehydrogenase subunit VorB, partial [Eubacteriales bacterium]|nr:3-methyl-2-oxobutanoate dehydrogenase subunit VorB [Eubacteriales bacterium]
MVYGVASTGKRVMTSSSSPGISLKCEGISYLAGCDLPALIVNVQRGGPGLGGIQPSQSDYFLATRGPGHGDFHVLVLAPASVQEMADITRKCFELAEKYRMPAMLLADGTMGQMMEPVMLPKPAVLDTTPKSWAACGTEGRRKHNIITSLDLSPVELERQNLERYKRYAQIEENEPLWEEFMLEDAEVCIVSCGITARVSRNAILEARKEGIKVGMLRPITLWPFPKKALAVVADKVNSFITVELNMGQMKEDVELAIRCKKPVTVCNRVGGMIPSPKEVLQAIKLASGKGACDQ